MIKIAGTVLGTALLGSPAFAETGNRDVSKVVAIEDGSSLIVFGDGNMGMQDRYGRSMHMSPGTVMKGRDGVDIAMVGNEVSKVHALRPRGQ